MILPKSNNVSYAPAEGLGQSIFKYYKIAVSYEDGDGYKVIKYYDFDKMMKRDPTEPVKVKAKFPRNTVAYYEDYLICATNLNNNQKNCSGDSRSPAIDKERIHVQIP
jgi:hypothetical protein